MREARTGVPLTTASITACAPPSIRLGCTSRCAAAMRARVAPCGSGPSQRYVGSRCINAAASAASASSSAAPMWSSRMSRRGASRRIAAIAVCGDFSGRRWPTMTARRWRDVFGGGRRAGADCRTTVARLRSAGGRRAAPTAFSTISRSATASERCAAGSRSMSRYRSVPVNASSSGRRGCRSRQAAIASADRRACSAIISASSPPCQASVTRTR